MKCRIQGVASCKGSSNDSSYTTINIICSDDNFDLFRKRITEMTGEMEIDKPVLLPRRRKLPRRYDDGSHEGDFPDTVENHYKTLFRST